MKMKNNWWDWIGEIWLCAFDFNVTDEVPVRKPVALQDQTVRDAQGRIRFHGAFTGGFSAGYFNTVDTKEGMLLFSSPQ